jgi:hypothetical protein
MHSVCIAAIHVTVNNTECYTTMFLWRIYSAGNYNRYCGLYFWSILTTFGVSRQIFFCFTSSLSNFMGIHSDRMERRI